MTSGVIMRRVLILAMMALAALVGACGEANNEEGGGGGGGPITLGVGVDSVFAPMFVAQEEGLFEEEGLDVKVQQFAQGGEGVDAVVAGAIQTAGAADTTMMGKATQGDIRGLGVFVEDVGNYTKLVTRKDISNPREIKKMGIVPGAIFEWGAVKMLDHFNIDPESVEFVPVDPAELPVLLQKGDIDAFVSPEPWPTEAEEAGGKVLMPSKEWGLSYVLLIAARSDWLRANREQAEALMRALAAGTRRVEDDPAAAAEVTEKVAKVPPELTKEAVADLEFGVRGFNDRDRGNFEDISAFLVERKLVKEEPSVSKFFEGDVVGGT